MPGEIVASNALLLARSATFRTYLNAGKVLRLFQNKFTPKPADKLAAFAEAVFPGYASVSLNNQFGAPTKVKDGLYAVKTPALSFVCTGASGQTVWGWYIDDGADVLLSRRFLVGVVMGVGISIEAIVQVETWAASILEEK